MLAPETSPLRDAAHLRFGKQILQHFADLPELEVLREIAHNERELWLEGGLPLRDSVRRCPRRRLGLLAIHCSGRSGASMANGGPGCNRTPEVAAHCSSRSSWPASPASCAACMQRCGCSCICVAVTGQDAGESELMPAEQQATNATHAHQPHQPCGTINAKPKRAEPSASSAWRSSPRRAHLRSPVQAADGRQLVRHRASLLLRHYRSVQVAMLCPRQVCAPGGRKRCNFRPSAAFTLSPCNPDSPTASHGHQPHPCGRYTEWAAGSVREPAKYSA
jgi:hypothetical protein